MIESEYWKEDLLNLAKSLSDKGVKKRITIRFLCVTEKQIVISFMIIRKLIELRKISDELREMHLRVSFSKANTNINFHNRFDFLENYDHKNERSEEKDIKFICDQFIHSQVLHLFLEKNREKSDIYVTSDHKMKKEIYRITTPEIVRVLKIFGKNYPSEMHTLWNEEKKDYDMSMK